MLGFVPLLDFAHNIVNRYCRLPPWSVNRLHSLPDGSDTRARLVRAAGGEFAVEKKSGDETTDAPIRAESILSDRGSVTVACGSLLIVTVTAAFAGIRCS